MDDVNNMDWTWTDEGKPSDDGLGKLYDGAKVYLKKEKKTREFRVGEAVYVDNGGGPIPWVAQIVEFYQAHSPDVDPEVEVVDDDLKKLVTLRWMYNPDDIDSSCREEVARENKLASPIKHELYFSDHVEKRGSNPIEVIEGRAYLVESPEKLQRVRAKRPDRSWPNDVIQLVRMFFDSRSSPGKLRELDKGELSKLLAYPSTEPVYCRTSRMSGGNFQAVLKGTRKRHLSYDSPPQRQATVIDYDSDGLPTSFGPPRLGKQGGHTPPKSRAGSSKIRAREQEALRPRSDAKPRRKLIISESESDEDDESPPPVRPRKETVEASGSDALGTASGSRSHPLPSSSKEKPRSKTGGKPREIVEASGKAPRGRYEIPRKRKTQEVTDVRHRDGSTRKTGTSAEPEDMISGFDDLPSNVPKSTSNGQLGLELEFPDGCSVDLAPIFRADPLDGCGEQPSMQVEDVRMQEMDVVNEEENGFAEVRKAFEELDPEMKRDVLAKLDELTAAVFQHKDTLGATDELCDRVRLDVWGDN